MLLLATLAGSCGRNSYVVVYVDADVNAVDPPLVMTSARVTVTSNGKTKEVFFPAGNSSGESELVFPATFALTVSPNHSGVMVIDIEGLDDLGQVAAHGTATSNIKEGQRTNVYATLVPGGFLCGDGSVDNGESCDEGAGNGRDGYCDFACRLVEGGTHPAADAGVDGGRTEVRTMLDGGSALDGGSPVAPVNPLSGSSFVSVSAGLRFTCGVRHDGSMYCWGDNSEKQLGINSTQALILSPMQLTGSRWQSVTAGQNHACALDSSGLITCWGRADSGQLGKPGAADQLPANASVQLADGDWSVVEAGAYHTCGKKQGNTLWCWGQNFSGQLGLGVSSATVVTVPTKVGEDVSWQMLAVGASHGCATRSDGTLWCWGSNSNGQLGTGSSANTFSPTQVSGSGFASVSAGAAHTCATYRDGTLACWGLNEAGQLGDGSTSSRKAPTLVAGNDWALVGAGGASTCAIKLDGSLWCWGDNASGQIGDGSLAGRIQPTQVKSVNGTWSAISLGNAHACGLLSTGALYCWGDNSKGQIGDGSVSARTKPYMVGSQ